MTKIKKENSFIRFSTSDCDESELVIDSVFVAKKDRGQGIGKSLVKEAIEYAKKNEFKTVGLYAEPQADEGLDGEALIEFYASCGFVSDKNDNQLMTYTI